MISVALGERELRPLQELDVVRLVRLEEPERDFDGSEGVARAPRVGDEGTIVDRRGDGAMLTVEMVDGDGMTVWVADCSPAEVELVWSPKKKPARTPIVVVLGCNAALLMAPIAALLSITSYVPDAEAGGLSMAAGLAAGALVLLAVCWQKLPRPIRLLAGPVALMACFALCTAVDRLLW